MPIGNPMQLPGTSMSGWRPSQKFGGGAGTLFRNAYGASTPVTPGTQQPQGFGINPITGAPVGSQAEAKLLTDPNSPQGKGLMQQIYSPQGQEIADMRRKLLQYREM